MKKKLKLFLSVCLLIVLFVSLYYLTLGMERIRVKPAELYINGKRLNMPATLYWYGRSAMFQLPLFDTLEALECEVVRDESNQGSDTLILAGKREFVVIKQGESFSDLYENGDLVYGDVARPKYGTKGPLYLDARDYKRVLTILGFEHITCEINENNYVVWLTAESEWQ